MNKADYAEYETAVADFMAREGIANLSSGHYQCPECKVELTMPEPAPVRSRPRVLE